MNKILVLVDVDRTLIDDMYQHNIDVSELNKCIVRVQDRGVIVGLNSDTALANLWIRYREYGMNGPIIAELGNIVYRQSDNLLKSREYSRIFIDIRKSFLDGLTNVNNIQKFFTIIGNANSVIDSMQSFNIGQSDADVAIVLNTLRTHSFSFYVRKFANGMWVTDDNSLDSIVNILENTYEFQDKGFLVSKDVNYKSGICILHHHSAKKSNALSVIEKIYPDYKIYMIGDSVSDLLNTSSVVQCAVANASEVYKVKCPIIAKNDYTKGVIEIIDTIIS